MKRRSPLRGRQNKSRLSSSRHRNQVFFEFLENRLALAATNAGLFDLSSLFPENGGDGSRGTVIRGAAAGDKSPYSFESSNTGGDINGDGIDDLLLGQEFSDFADRTDAGTVDALFGKHGGLGSIVDLADPIDGITIIGAAAYDHTALSVRAAGDINGDGVDDITVGAEFNSANGKAFIVYGSTSLPQQIDLAELDSTRGVSISGSGYNNRFGISVASGNFNGDSFDDAMVGAELASAMRGTTSFVMGSSHLQSGTSPASIAGKFFDDQSGISVGASDLNGDNIDDPIIGAFRADPQGRLNAGEAYIVFGYPGFDGHANLTTLDGNSGFTIQGANSNDQLGRVVAGLGDINGDHLKDLIVGAPGVNNGAGAAYVIYGHDEPFASAIDVATLDGTNGFSIFGSHPGDALGSSVSSAGDWNNDGCSDIVVGIPGADGSALANNGAVALIFGCTHAGLTEVDPNALDGQNGMLIEGISSFDRLGQSVGFAGDLNADSVSDIVFVAPGADPVGRASAGESYILYGEDRDLHNKLASLRIEVVDSDDRVVSEIRTGDEFTINVFVRDLSLIGHGVFSAYADLLFDSGLVAVNGPLKVAFPNGISGTMMPGRIDEGGGFGTITSSGTRESLLYSVPFRAVNSGLTTFALDPADLSPEHDTYLFGRDEPLSGDQVYYGSTNLAVIPGLTVNHDAVDTDEDTEIRIDILANDTGTSSGTLRITHIPERTSLGAALSVVSNAVVYSPVDEITIQSLGSGSTATDMFSYTVADDDGNSASAFVTVTVRGLNDGPTTRDDESSTTAGVPITIDVLTNDTDIDGTLEAATMTVLQPPFGRINLLGNGNIQYIPERTFVGTDFFTYVVRDDAGAQSEVAHVTIQVSSAWHNLNQSRDVDADGYIAPIDALIVINYVNDNGLGLLPIYLPEGNEQFVDVDGDMHVSPGDVILIINHLNAESQANVLFRDDFEGEDLDLTKWVLPAGDGTFFGRTQIRSPSQQPDIRNGSLTLQLDTFNPTALVPGDSFLGTEVRSRDDFVIDTNSTLSFTARMRYLNGTTESLPPGLVTAFFGWSLNSSDSPLVRDEIDVEILSSCIFQSDDQVLTNVFSQDDFSKAGFKQLVSTSGLDVTEFNTYSFHISRERLDFFINGRLVRSVVEDLPTSSLEMRLNIWAPDHFFAEAFSDDLLPVVSVEDNRIFASEIDYVEVKRISHG